MPVVLARDSVGKSDRSVAVVFPRRSAAGDDGVDGGWEWDEVAVCASSIEGYGLETRQSPQLDWGRLRRPVYIPLLGRETEFGSADEADIFARILQGDFVAFPYSHMMPAPPGFAWASCGLYVELTAMEDGTEVPTPGDGDQIRTAAAQKFARGLVLGVAYGSNL